MRCDASTGSSVDASNCSNEVLLAAAVEAEPGAVV
eukprot:CAMPEP_0202870156 /NCGR_PEP_ID=MMETSP1391-20130828/14768_1 /ASSEMBLY_ACC=CAM_ASM_000867 /TAXON_ID=1034604 /ORGANISM="Chlamydomonas leiostraca, Strain SAG 11-49" /LENGTH=34 /DNA_ID= /DNA_START= /DNA_END= /DNA_ORIENTATION=